MRSLPGALLVPSRGIGVADVAEVISAAAVAEPIVGSIGRELIGAALPVSEAAPAASFC